MYSNSICKLRIENSWILNHESLSMVQHTIWICIMYPNFPTYKTRTSKSTKFITTIIPIVCLIYFTSFDYDLRCHLTPRQGTDQWLSWALRETVGLLLDRQPSLSQPLAHCSHGYNHVEVSPLMSLLKATCWCNSAYPPWPVCWRLWTISPAYRVWYEHRLKLKHQCTAFIVHWLIDSLIALHPNKSNYEC